MAEGTTGSVTPPSSTPAQDAPQTPQSASGAGGVQIDQLSESDLRALAAKLQDRLKDVNAESAERRHTNKELTGQLSTLQQSLQQIQADLQAEKERRAAAEKAATEAKTAAERQTMITEIAAKFSLPSTLAARLVGDTREALEADAESLAKELGQRGQQQGAGNRAGNSTWQGGLTLDQIANMTQAEIAARMDEVDAALKQAK